MNFGTLACTSKQFVIDSCCLVSHSNHLTHSNRRFDWLKISVLYESIKHADDTFDSFCKQKASENKGKCVGKMMDSLS